MQSPLRRSTCMPMIVSFSKLFLRCIPAAHSQLLIMGSWPFGCTQTQLLTRAFAARTECAADFTQAALHTWKSTSPADDAEPQSESSPEDALVWRQSLLLILLMLESMPKPGDRGSTHLAKEEIVQVLEEMVLPAVQHSTAAVRVDGLRWVLCPRLFLSFPLDLENHAASQT